MTAIVVGEARPPSAVPLLWPLVDRPFIQHVVERLVAQDIHDIQLVVDDPHGVMRHLFGDGTRWGVRITHHHAEPTQAYGLLRFLCGHEPFLLVHGNRLLRLDDLHVRAPERPIAYRGPVRVSQLRETEWTGWAWMTPELVRTLPATPTWSNLERALTRSCGVMQRPVQEVLSAESAADICLANRRALANPDGLLVTGREAVSGIRLGRGSRVHPRARLVPPVYVGPDAEIGPEVVLGPFATVGAGSIIDRGTTLSRSVVCPLTYVGEQLEIRDSVVDGHYLHNTRLRTTVRLADCFLLSRLASWTGEATDVAVSPQLKEIA